MYKYGVVQASGVDYIWDMIESNSHDSPRHPIRVAAERAGLTPELLRAWERRYAVVSPGRAQGGQRLYSDVDIERLCQLARLSHAGRSVGTLVRLPAEELERLVTEEAEHRAAQPSDIGSHRRRALVAARAMDGVLLFALLRRAVLSVGTPRFLEEVLSPVITELGHAWQEEEIGIAREHAATATIEQMLGWLIREFSPPDTAPRVLLAAPAGERHALGSMIAGAMAAHDGWHPTWVGVDLPASQIAAAAERDGALVVALGVVASADRDATREEVTTLRRELPSRIPLIVGGSGATALADVAGVTAARDQSHWRSLLQRHAPLSNG